MMHTRVKFHENILYYLGVYNDGRQAGRRADGRAGRQAHVPIDRVFTRCIDTFNLYDTQLLQTTKIV